MPDNKQIHSDRTGQFWTPAKIEAELEKIAQILEKILAKIPLVQQAIENVETAVLEAKK